MKLFKLRPNKLWFSQKQFELCSTLFMFDGINKNKGTRLNYVKTKTGWKQYSEWCSKGQKSNWGDAILV